MKERKRIGTFFGGFATALALQAIREGDGVAFYSLEMTPRQLTGRLASMISGVPASTIMFRKMEVTDGERVERAITELSSLPLFFDGRSDSSLESILTSARRMKSRHGIKGIVVDYLQLVGTGHGRDMNREQAVARVARALKDLAKELDIWVLLISQLSRDRANPRPSLSRLRDSGQIEEAADNIYLIYRPGKGMAYPEPFADVNPEGTAMVTIAKGRNSGTGEFICGFDAAACRFYPLADCHKEKCAASGTSKEKRASDDPFFTLRSPHKG